MIYIYNHGGITEEITRGHGDILRRQVMYDSNILTGKPRPFQIFLDRS